MTPLKPKTEKPMDRMQRSWKLAVEFGIGYPVGESERAKLVDHAPPSGVGGRCGSCGAFKR